MRETRVKRSALDSGIWLKILIPRKKKRTKKASHKNVPAIPVEATWVDIKLAPKGKATAQKGVVLILTGL